VLSSSFLLQSQLRFLWSWFLFTLWLHHWQRPHTDFRVVCWYVHFSNDTKEKS